MGVAAKLCRVQLHVFLESTLRVNNACSTCSQLLFTLSQQHIDHDRKRVSRIRKNKP
jgi:hypothetical protein